MRGDERHRSARGHDGVVAVDGAAVDGEEKGGAGIVDAAGFPGGGAGQELSPVEGERRAQMVRIERQGGEKLGLL